MNTITVPVSMKTTLRAKLERMSKRRRKIALKRRLTKHLMRFAGARVCEATKEEMLKAVQEFFDVQTIDKSVVIKVSI